MATRKKNTRIIVLSFVCFLLIALIYFQFFQNSRQVAGGFARLDKVLTGHHAEVWTVRFSLDGKSLASASVDSTVIIRAVSDGRIEHVLKHPESITSADYSPNGQYIVTGSYDSVVRIWEISGEKLIRELRGHKGTVWAVSFSPDGNTIASCGDDRMVRLWDVASGKNIQTMKGHLLNVWCVKFSTDGSRVASGSFDRTIKIWDVSSGSLLQTFNGHAEAVVALAFSHDGKTLASSSDDKTIRLWDMKTGRVSKILEEGPEHVQAVEFSPDDKRILCGGRDKSMAGEFLQNIFGDSHINKGVSMRLWDIREAKVIQTFSEHANDVNDVAWSPDGKWIASASADHTVGIWKMVK